MSDPDARDAALDEARAEGRREHAALMAAVRELVDELVLCDVDDSEVPGLARVREALGESDD